MSFDEDLADFPVARLGIRPPAVEAIPSSAYPTPERRPRSSRLDCGQFAEHFGLRLRAWEGGVERCLAEFVSTT
jgi:dTDP-4-dehydrorhamnose reductase